MPILPLILTLLACLALLIFIAAYLMARLLLHPPRMSDAKAAWVLKRLSPADLALPFQPLSFIVRDNHTGQPLSIAAWWIPHPNSLGRTAVFVHGYADAKVGALAWAPTFHSLAYNLLLYDLRAHGESEGRFTTAGHHEQHDLNQLLDQLRAEKPAETRHLVLFGLSMGAAIASATAISRDDLAAVILDSPSADESHAAMIQFNLLGLPGSLVQRLALRIVRWITGAHFAAIRPVDLIPKIPCPLFIISPSNDVYVPPTDLADIQSAANSRPPSRPTVFWRIDGAAHLMAICADPDEYRHRLSAFLSPLTPDP